MNVCGNFKKSKIVLQIRFRVLTLYGDAFAEMFFFSRINDKVCVFSTNNINVCLSLV